MPGGADEEIAILLVDDDRDAARVASRFIERDRPAMSVATAPDAAAALEAHDLALVDCVVSDFDIPERDGLDLLEAVRDREPEMPFILFTGQGSEEIASEAISAGVTDYLQRTGAGEQYAVLANRIENAVERRRAERRARESARVSEVVRDIVHAVVRAGSREEIVAAVCDRLAEADAYRMTWWGEVVDDRVEPVEHAGAESGYLEDLTITVGEEATGRGPTGTAVRTGEIQVAQDIENESDFEPWRDRAISRSFRASAAIPVVHEGELHGVLTVYADRVDAFDAAERALFADLAGAVGHALSAAETRSHLAAANEKVRSLNRVAADFERRSTVEGVCEQTVAAAEEVLAFANCAVNVERDGTLPIVAFSREPPGGIPEPRSVEEGLVGKTFRSGETRLVTDVAGIEDADPVAAYRSALLVPIADRGVFQAVSYEQDAFDAHDRDLAELLVEHTEAALRRLDRERELERYARIVEASGDPVYTVDPDGRFTFVNDAFVELTGYDREELVGRRAEALGGEMASERVLDALGDLLETDRTGSRTVEVDLKTRDGEPRRVEVHLALLPDEGGVRGTVGVVRDVTDRVETERALRGERDRLSALFENVPEPVIYYEFEAGEPHIRGVNPAFEETFGYPAESAVGEAIDDLLVSPDYAEEAARLNEQVAAAEHLDAEVTRETVAGPREFLLRNAPLPTQDETIAGYAIYTDITERKQTERRVHALFDYSTDCIAETEYVDGEPVVRRVNPAFEEIFGFDAEAIVGESIDDFVVPDRLDAEAVDINERTMSGDAVEEEVRRLTADGERDFLLRSVPFQVGDTKRDYTVYTDITERKRHERELERTNERLDAFASVVSHDIRNPLLAARGRLDLLRREEDLDHADGIADALDRIEGIVEDVLALAREGEAVTDPSTVDLADLAERCWRTVEGDAVGLTVVDDLTVMADRTRLRRLLENLFRNALEHAGDDDGAPTVEVGPLEDGFYVADDGRGVPESRREEVFEWGVSTVSGGTGFGLAIVEEIAAAHDWRVTLTESAAGGARFEFAGVERVDG